MYPNITYNRIRDGAIGLVTRLWDGCSGVPTPMETKVCFFSRNVHTVSESLSVSYCVGMGTLTPGKSGQSLRVTTLLHLIPRLRTTGLNNPVLTFTAYVLITLLLLCEKPIFVSHRNKLLLHY